MSSLLPKLSALEEKFNVQIVQINSLLSQIQSEKPAYQPKTKTNIIAILQESFGLQDCASIIRKKAQDNNDNLCLEILNNGFFHPKMIHYISEHLNKQIIIYNPKKKKYFKYGQKNDQPIFIYQKTSQIFNVMKKKIKKPSPNEAQIQPLTSLNNYQPTIFSKQPNQQDSIDKQIEQQIQLSIKKQLDSQVKEALKQSFKKAYQTPNRSQFNKINASDNNHDDILEESEEESIFYCGGKMQSCSNQFNDLEDYQTHIRKIHRGKVPKNSSHSINGQKNE